METEGCQREYNPLCGVIVWPCRAGGTNLVVVMWVTATMGHSGAIRLDVKNLLPFAERIFHLSICIGQLRPLGGQRVEAN